MRSTQVLNTGGRSAPSAQKVDHSETKKLVTVIVRLFSFERKAPTKNTTESHRKW